MSNLTKEECTKRANKLLKMMTTPGWMIRVWENLGWHWSIASPYVYVHTVNGEDPEDPKARFSAMMNEKGDYSCYDASGLFGGFEPHWFTDPNEAVKRRLEAAESINQEVANILKDIRNSLQLKKE